MYSGTLNFTKICRWCLSESSEMDGLYSCKLPEDNICLTDFIHKLTGIKVSKDDGLPEKMCCQCSNKISGTFEFIQNCIKADIVLRQQRNREILDDIQKDIVEEENSRLEIIKEEIEEFSDVCLEASDSKTNLYSVDLKATVDTVDVKVIDVCHDADGDVCHDADADIFHDVECAVSSDEDKSDVLKLKHTKKNEEFVCRTEKYSCSECEVTFSNKTKYKYHMKIHDKKPFRCKECLQTFSKKIHLTAHAKIHFMNESKQFVCDKCGKHCAYEYLLKQHQYKHKDEKPFPCTKCDRGCLTAESLRRHMRIHDENYTRKTHKCNTCSKEFAYPSSLAEHMKNHTGEKPYLCSVCGKGFRQVGALRYHQRIHTGLKPFSCNICNENFTTQSILKVHLRKHTNERPYICHVCGMRFRQSTDLKSHQRTHSGEKPVLCPLCGKRMASTGQLTVHLRFHTGEKPFKCNDCNKAFTTNTMLVKHKRIHTGERPYVCDVCGKAFNQKSTLNTHANTHLNKNKKNKSSIPETKDSVPCSPSEEENEQLETEVITDADQYIGNNIVTLDGSSVRKITVILPAPIPLLQNS